MNTAYQKTFQKFNQYNMNIIKAPPLACLAWILHYLQTNLTSNCLQDTLRIVLRYAEASDRLDEHEMGIYTVNEIVIVTGTALTRHNWLTISGLWEHSSHSGHGQTNLLEGPPSNGLACNNHVAFWDWIVTVYRYGSKLYVCCMATAMKFASPGPKFYAKWCIIPYLTFSIWIKFSLLVCTKSEHWNVTWVLIHLHCSSK